MRVKHTAGYSTPVKQQRDERDILSTAKNPKPRRISLSDVGPAMTEDSSDLQDDLKQPQKIEVVDGDKCSACRRRYGFHCCYLFPGEKVVIVYKTRGLLMCDICYNIHRTGYKKKAPLSSISTFLTVNHDNFRQWNKEVVAVIVL